MHNTLHVIISFEEVSSPLAAGLVPLEHHEGLDGEVGVGVGEALLQDVPVPPPLLPQPPLHLGPLLLFPHLQARLPHQEHHPHCQAASLQCPGLEGSEDQANCKRN